ncbi:hypothetical protein JG687_00018377 [Phytophthora cactorum]|uniref:Uncharacterized protein n=1 Tax=Phytophthora cactorum TaxID=29920 RepID=A0A8T1TMW5_9STRA|nr:hypothetical protein JG687_00018377 [Phytophthora cactorum]
MSRIVAQAWDAIPAKVIVSGFIKLGLVPTGPRNRVGRFRIPQVVAGDAPAVCVDSETEKKTKLDFSSGSYTICKMFAVLSWCVTRMVSSFL